MVNNQVTVEVTRLPGFETTPHNQTPDQVRALIANTVDELTLLMIKPGFFPMHPEDGAPIQAEMEAMLRVQDLKVQATDQRYLSPLEVCELYGKVTPPDQEDEAKWGLEWKRKLITYLVGGMVFSYLITGNNATEKTRVIKNSLRTRYAVDPETQVIRNIGHVPDFDELDMALQILFFEGLSPDDTRYRKL